MARPKVPILEPSHVVKVALQLIDADGLEGFSVRRLAHEFNVNDGSLYHHFTSKEELLRRVATDILLEVGRPDEQIADWADLVIKTATDFRRVLLRHPNAIPVMLRHQTARLVPALYGPYAELLRQRGVPDDLVMPILDAFDVLVMGSAAAHHAHLSAGDTKTIRSWPSLRQAEETFEYQCRTLAAGFQAQLDRASR